MCRDGAREGVARYVAAARITGREKGERGEGLTISRADPLQRQTAGKGQRENSLGV